MIYFKDLRADTENYMCRREFYHITENYILLFTFKIT